MARVALFLALVALAGTAGAQDNAQDVVKTVDETVGIQQQTQVDKDEWAAERAALESRYRSALANVEYLTAQRDLQQGRVDALNERIGEFERRLSEADRLQSSIQDTLDVVMLRLEDWVAQDLPFLHEERTRRIESLRADMARPDIEPHNKLRRLLEALQIEAAYGSTVEVTQEEIRLGEEPLYVDILRIGRLSLFWKTPDGKRVGEYDRGTASWRELDGKYNRPITTAMEMATRMRPTELVALPLGRISR